MGSCIGKPVKENDATLKRLSKNKKAHKKHANNNGSKSSQSIHGNQLRYVINKKRKNPSNSQSISLAIEPFDLNESFTKRISKSNSNVSNRTSVSKNSVSYEVPPKYDPVNKFNKNAYIALFDYAARTTEDLSFKRGKNNELTTI